MTMIAHYRLDGNAEDSIGNYDGNVVGNTSWVDGKIGGSIQFSEGRVDTDISDDMRDFTFSTWFKKTTTDWGSISVAGTRRSQTGWMLYRNAGDTDGYFRWYNHYVRTDGTISSYRAWPGISNLQVGRWYHIVATRSSDGFSNLYVDGILVSASTPPNDFEDWSFSSSDIKWALAGGQGAGSTTWNGNGMELDDFRIYDHVLSLREVRDLSQAKAAHFKFDQFSEPTENLFSQPFLGDDDTHYWLWGSSISYDTPYNILVNTTDNNRGLVFDFQGLSDGDTITKTIRFRFKSGDTASFTASSTDFTSLNRTLNGEPVGTTVTYNSNMWNTYSITGTATSTSPRMRFYPQGPSEVEIMWMQFEKKGHATPFVEDSRQGFITDASNQGNDTEIALASSPRWVENTPIGSGAYEFNKVDTVITLPNAEPSIVGDMTISFWLNIRSDNVRTTLIDKAYGGEFTINLETNGPRLRLYRGDAGGNNHNYVSVTTGAIGMNKWVHATITVNGHTATWYLDGEFESSSTSSLFVGSKSNNNVRIGKGYTSGYVDGFLSDLRFYAEGFKPEEIKEIYQQRASLDDHGNLHTHQINNVLNYDEAIGTSNLVLNANGELGDNTNFENFQYLGDGVFSRTSGSSTILHPDYIPIKGNGIDRFEPYVLQGEVRGQDAQSRYYFMIACYNKFKQRINNEHMNFYSGTDTTLSQPLNAGDTWAYFNDVSGWRDSGTGSYINGMSFAYWLDSFDPIFVPLKYSRTHVRYLEVDTTNNRIRLQNTWSGDSLPAGTLAINSRSGGTYSYIAASNDWTILDKWDYKESGPTSTTPSTGSMRFATEFVRVGWLINRNSTDGTPTTQIKNIKFHAVNKDQNPTWISNGAGNEFKMQDFSEVGIAPNLQLWNPLIKDVYEYAEGRSSVNSGAVPTGDGYLFNGTDSYVRVTGSDINSGSWEYAEASFSMWVKPDNAAATGDQNIITIERTFEIAVRNREDGTSSIRYASNPWAWRDISSEYAVNGEWNYIVYVHEFGRRLVYLNGVLIYTSTEQGYLDDTNTDWPWLTIGGRYGGTGSSFDGIIKDVRMYSSRLSEEEILINYKHSLNNNNTKMSLTSDTVYINGQFNEV